MTQSSYPVGYGRPPVHSQFQKGHSGNPGGKPGPKRRLKDEFAEALASAFDGTMRDLRDARPQRGIEVLARVVALHALEGRSSAQKIVLGLLDGKDGANTGASPEAEAEGEAEHENQDDDAESEVRASEDDTSRSSGESAGEDEDDDDDDDEEEELTTRIGSRSISRETWWETGTMKSKIGSDGRSARVIWPRFAMLWAKPRRFE